MFGLIIIIAAILGIPFFGCIAQKEFSIYAAGLSYLAVATVIALFSAPFYALGSDTVSDAAEKWMGIAGGLLVPFGICQGIALGRLGPQKDRRRKK